VSVRPLGKRALPVDEVPQLVRQLATEVDDTLTVTVGDRAARRELDRDLTGPGTGDEAVGSACVGHRRPRAWADRVHGPTGGRQGRTILSVTAGV